jgi:hypothetical protein
MTADGRPPTAGRQKIEDGLEVYLLSSIFLPIGGQRSVVGGHWLSRSLASLHFSTPVGAFARYQRGA